MKHAEHKKKYYNAPENMVVWVKSREDDEWIEMNIEPNWEGKYYTVHPKGEDPNEPIESQIKECEIEWHKHGYTISFNSGRYGDVWVGAVYNGYRCIGFRFADDEDDDKCIAMKYKYGKVVGSEKATHAILEKVKED
jgi:hypothetical protein